jgi:hypothetical protein
MNGILVAGSLAALLFGTAVAHGACPVTRSSTGKHENDSLLALLPPGGKFVFRPGGAGFVDHDGALGIKFAWDRKKKGQLAVGGRRLDGTASPLRAYLYDYGDTGFQPVYLVFPTPGCWEVEGRVADSQILKFVVEVEKVGDGPPWRFEGLERGWRMTSGV